jgi:Raf kinase inhibitor-like YbhB/YbcL family protein
MNRTRMTFGAVLLLLLAGCASAPSSTSPTPQASVTGTGPSFVVTSTDFVDGGGLDVRFSANAWEGQCSGDNLNPQLSWEGAPEGTVAYAITMRDLSAGNWSHWVHVNIPADITSVATGESGSLPGVVGRNASPGAGYFGPCPPGPGHRYEFTIWALDAELDLPAEPTYQNFFTASRDHILGQASIIGVL